MTAEEHADAWNVAAASLREKAKAHEINAKTAELVKMYAALGLLCQEVALGYIKQARK